MKDINSHILDKANQLVAKLVVKKGVTVDYTTIINKVVTSLQQARSGTFSYAMISNVKNK